MVLWSPGVPGSGSMPEFRYTALDGSGREVSGALQAEDRAGALSRIKSMGMSPMALDMSSGGAAAVSVGRGAAPALAAEAPKAGFSLLPRKVGTADLALFTRQLASLFNAGLNIARSLDTLIEHSENPALRNALTQVRQGVQGGTSLWESLAEHPKIFNDLYVNLVRAGEASGQLGNVLDRLADTLEQQQDRQSKLRSALAYPIVLISAGVSAVLFILVFLVPRFAKIFASLNRPLPAPTKALLALQAFVSQWGWLVALLMVAAYFAFKQWEATEQGGLVVDRIRMRIWLIGTLIHKEAVSRFCRTMGTLVEGGVPILTSFEVAERAVGNRVLRQAIDQVRSAVREGESLAEPLARTGVFPKLVTNMIAVGEETGNLQEMLNRVADAYDAEINNRTRQLMSLVEPMVILLMGAIIGTIVVSMLVPVLELSTGFN